MTSLATTRAGSATAESGRRSMFVTALGGVGYALLLGILVEALLEGWLLIQLGQLMADRSGPGGLDSTGLVKGARNAAYVALVIVTGLRVVGTGRLRMFLTPADAAFAFLLGAMVVAGLVGGSSPTLTALGIFVYARGAIVFYAIRGLDVGSGRRRIALLIVGSIVVLQAAVAVLQTLTGPSGYGLLGITDLSWAGAGRAQGLFTHPNHLGHVTGLAVIGILAWRVPRVGARWWLLFALLAFAMGLSQSRESIAGAILALGTLAAFQGRHIRTTTLGIVLIAVLAGLALLAQPGTGQALALKISGVFTAIEIPSGSESTIPATRRCDPDTEDCTASGVPKRSTRVLLYQQGLRLWAQNPLLGYGVGQFGGGVAAQNDPQWYLDPRFGPEGFRLYGMNLSQVDSFWLHLLVETGAIGALAYLAWLGTIAWPSAVGVWRGRGRALPPVEADRPIDRWALAALMFGVVIAFFSPSLEDPLFPPLLFGVLGMAWSPVAATGHHSSDRG